MSSTTMITAIAGGSLTRFTLAALWYGPICGNLWVKGMDEDKGKSSKIWMHEGYPMPVLFGSSICTALIDSFLLFSLFTLGAPETNADFAKLTFGVVGTKLAELPGMLWAGRNGKLVTVSTGEKIVLTMIQAFVIFKLM